MSKLRTRFLEAAISLVITLLSIASASVFVLFFRPIYYLCIEPFHIIEKSGFTKQEIMKNYNALIRYFNPFDKKPLALPTFGQSPQGIQHFAEVKTIFNMLLILIPICLIILTAYVLTRRQRDKHYLKSASITLIVVPILAGAGFALNFDATFTLFHKLFFRNNYWLFDSKTDPIIKILPEEFFLLCGIIIIVIQLLVSAVCSIRYYKFKKK